MSQEEVKRFLDRITDKRDRALFLLIYKYGLRPSEAVSLNLVDLNLSHNRLFIRRSKGSLAGEKPLFKDVRRVVKAYLVGRNDNSTALFTGLQGRLQIRRIQDLFRQYAKKAKLPAHFTTRSLRHSIAVHMLDAGLDIHFVQDHLGHKNIQNTQVYARISSSKRNQVFKDLEHSADIVSI